MVDQFAKGLGYLPLVTRDLKSGRFETLERGEYDLGKSIKRHGSILKITQDEYARVAAAYGLEPAAV